jgi:flagellar basal-body rod protein FlgG
MLRGLHTAGTAMLAQTRRMDVITNNITNVETKGYKADVLVTKSFRDMLISRIKDPSPYEYTVVGPHNTGIHIDYNHIHFTQGSMEETGVSTDFALAGDGFFVVNYTPATEIPPEDPEEALDPDYEPEYELGEPEDRYTRGGTFAVDAEGFLCTPDGRYIQGAEGNIQVGSTEFSVNAYGEIYIENEQGGQEYVDTLRVVRFTDNQLLRKEGNNLYSVIYPEENIPEELVPGDAQIEVKQGYLENANVDTAREMVNMIEVQRHYELNQRVLKTYDESLGRAVNEIARV